MWHDSFTRLYIDIGMRGTVARLARSRQLPMGSNLSCFLTRCLVPKSWLKYIFRERKRGQARGSERAREGEKEIYIHMCAHTIHTHARASLSRSPTLSFALPRTRSLLLPFFFVFLSLSIYTHKHAHTHHVKRTHPPMHTHTHITHTHHILTHTSTHLHTHITHKIHTYKVGVYEKCSSRARRTAATTSFASLVLLTLLISCLHLLLPIIA